MSELPKSVRIREVGPRDGFQNEPEVIPTDEKVRLIRMLAASGLQRLEVTSFVRPDVIPQLADAEQVLAQLERPEGVAYSVLIPNERGLERALAHRDRFDEINLFLSASETHNKKNVNSSIAESLAGLERTIARGLREGLRCEGVISVSFGCPYEGEVPAERVFEIAARLAEAGCEEVAFGDTTGMANPRQVGEFFAAARQRLRGSSSPRTSTTPAGRASPTSFRRSSREWIRSSRRSASWAAARCRQGRRGTSPPRTWSRCCTRWASTRGSTWRS